MINPYTNGIIAILILMGVLFQILTQYYPGTLFGMKTIPNNLGGGTFELLNILVLCVFATELLVRLMAFGLSFLHDPFYIFDTIAILLAFAAIPPFGILVDNKAIRNVLGILRLLRVFRILKDMDQFRVIFETSIQVVRAFFTLWLGYFCLLYLYACLGMEMYHGLINERNAKRMSCFAHEVHNITGRIPADTHYTGSHTATCFGQAEGLISKPTNGSALNELTCFGLPVSEGICPFENKPDWWLHNVKDSLYWANTMDTFWDAIIVMVELTVVNQWHVLTSMYVDSGVDAVKLRGYGHVPPAASYLYFYSYYVLAVMVLVNVLTAVVVDAFVMQQEQVDIKVRTVQYKWEANIIDGLELTHGKKKARSMRLLRPETKAITYMRLYGGDDYQNEKTDKLRTQPMTASGFNEDVFLEHQTAAVMQRRKGTGRRKTVQDLYLDMDKKDHR